MFHWKVFELDWALPGLPWKIHWKVPVLSAEMIILEGMVGPALLRISCNMLDASSRALELAILNGMNCECTFSFPKAVCPPAGLRCPMPQTRGLRTQHELAVCKSTVK